MFRYALLGALALVVLANVAVAAAAPGSLCIDLSVPKGAVAAHDGKWIAMTPEQFQFIRGVYAMNPATPAGLPYGESAVLATVPGNGGGMVFFIDGKSACTPMPIPGELIKMLGDVATGALNHEGANP